MLQNIATSQHMHIVNWDLMWAEKHTHLPNHCQKMQNVIFYHSNECHISVHVYERRRLFVLHGYFFNLKKRNYTRFFSKQENHKRQKKE